MRFLFGPFGLAVVVSSLFTNLTVAQFAIQGPGVDPADFRITTFADGLNFPVGMASLPDGSVLVAVSNGNSFFGSNSGSILRLVDSDQDGIADQQTTLFNNVPGGGLSSLRVAGDLVFTTGQGNGKPISVFRLGAMPSDPLTLEGSLTINYPGSWLHPHSALGVREAPGQPGSYELFFQLGSRENFAATTSTATLTSSLGVNGTLAGDALHRVTITDHGNSVTAGNLTQIATGLRNSAGYAFHPLTGGLYLQDNGIDGLVNLNEPLSADELNVLPEDQIGGAIESFGFPDTYVEYRTGVVVGNTGIQPLVAIQPIPDPMGDREGEGPNDIAFAPPQFPPALQNGIFMGMHGRFSQGGINNEENPLVFIDLNDNSYFHFIGNDEPLVGHLDGLLSTRDSLFVADISPGGGFGTSDAFTGKIYQIQSLFQRPDVDFNDDGFIDCVDIDSLTREIAGGTNRSAFDLTGDGLVDQADLQQWLADAGAANLPSGQPYLPGDANLSGDVDGSDFGIWNMNKFQNVDAWCAGDFSADGSVDGSDFGIWNSHKFSTSAANAVPESAIHLAWLVLFLHRVARISHHRVGRNEPTPTLPELRSPRDGHGNAHGVHSATWRLRCSGNGLLTIA